MIRLYLNGAVRLLLRGQSLYRFLIFPFLGFPGSIHSWMCVLSHLYVKIMLLLVSLVVFALKSTNRS